MRLVRIRFALIMALAALLLSCGGNRRGTVVSILADSAGVPPGGLASDNGSGGVLPGIFIAGVLMAYTVYRTRHVPVDS